MKISFNLKRMQRNSLKWLFFFIYYKSPKICYSIVNFFYYKSVIMVSVIGMNKY